MKNIILIALVLAIFTTISCKKDDDDKDGDVKPEVYQPKGYIQLSVGNYWIYQHYKVVDDGTDSILSLIDTVSINGTIEHNGETFYKVETSNWLPSIVYLRDSVGNLIDTSGIVLMSENNFNDTIYSRNEYIPNGEPLIHVAAVMYNENKSINTPLANFTDCIERRVYTRVYHTSPPPKDIVNSHYYAKNIGLVQSNYSVVGSSNVLNFERKLIYYSVVTVIN